MADTNATIKKDEINMMAGKQLYWYAVSGIVASVVAAVSTIAVGDCNCANTAGTPYPEGYSGLTQSCTGGGNNNVSGSGSLGIKLPSGAGGDTKVSGDHSTSQGSALDCYVSWNYHDYYQKCEGKEAKGSKCLNDATTYLKMFAHGDGCVDMSTTNTPHWACQEMDTVSGKESSDKTTNCS